MPIAIIPRWRHVSPQRRRRPCFVILTIRSIRLRKKLQKIQQFFILHENLTLIQIKFRSHLSPPRRSPVPCTAPFPRLPPLIHFRHYFDSRGTDSSDKRIQTKIYVYLYLYSIKQNCYKCAQISEMVIFSMKQINR